ncbi:hypothetical protein [uncultured Microscilla sp.]|uniref:hypothetical protein n=1 Tax=uncultured Microscilla sp. TaxID=432653 RepID=UPI0026371344|nr:hypothetical protein [uncultured Microscilla sp.]
MEDKQTFIAQMEKLIQLNHIGEAIEGTLEFLDLRPETYLRDAAMKLSGRWAVMNEAIEDQLVDKVTEVTYLKEIREDLEQLKKLIIYTIQEDQTALAQLPPLPKLLPPDFNQLLFDHSLRPAFTEKIAKTLFLQHTSVNIYGEDGAGKSRLFTDLLKALRLISFDNYRPVFIDFKNHAYAYDDMLLELHKQLGTGSEVPTDFMSFFEDIEQQNRWYLLFFYHFDAILDNPKIDTGFNAHFFDQLNALKNKRNVGLIVTTQQPHRGSYVFAEGKAYSNSWLNLKMEAIPALTDMQVTIELEKRLSNDYFQWLHHHPNERKQIEQKIRETPNTYQMLVFLAEQLNAKADEEVKFDERLHKWQKKYDEANSEQRTPGKTPTEKSGFQLLKKSLSPLINLFRGKK